MDDGFEVILDRQWRPAVIAVSLSEIPKGSYQRYNQMSEEIIQKMVEDLSKIATDPIALSFNAGSWVRSRRFHIKAHVTVDAFCEMLKSRGQDTPNDQQKKSLVTRSSQIDVVEAAAEFSKKSTSRVFKINGFACWRLADSVQCKFSYLKLSRVETPKEVKKVVETFEQGWFAEQYAKTSYGFAVYLLPANHSKGWDLFIRIDPGEYSRLFPKSEAALGAYRAPKRKYRA